MASISWLTDHLFEIIIAVAVLLAFIFIVFVSQLIFKGADWACTMYLKNLEEGGIIDFIEAKVAEFIIKAFNFKCGMNI